MLEILSLVIYFKSNGRVRLIVSIWRKVWIKIEVKELSGIRSEDWKRVGY